MEKKEYLSVKEIAQTTNQTIRNVRRKLVTIIKENDNEYLINRTKDNRLRIHHLMLPKFAPKRIRKNKYYALTIDPKYFLSESEIKEIMQFVFDNLDDGKTEINYVVEQKKLDDKNHIHCFIKSEQKSKVLTIIRMAFAQISYKQTPIFDLENWKNYITKNNNQITTLK